MSIGSSGQFTPFLQDSMHSNHSLHSTGPPAPLVITNYFAHAQRRKGERKVNCDELIDPAIAQTNTRYVRNVGRRCASKRQLVLASPCAHSLVVVAILPTGAFFHREPIRKSELIAVNNQSPGN